MIARLALARLALAASLCLALGQAFAAPTSVTIATHDGAPPFIKDLAKDRCFRIREIVVDGIELISPDAIRRAVEPLAWRCLGNVLAKSIIAAINDAHSAKGYVTTQGYVQAQDIKGTKRLVIHVVTGKIAKIVTHEHANDQTPSEAWAGLLKAAGPMAFGSAVLGLWQSLAWPAEHFQAVSPDSHSDLKTWLAMPAAPGDPLDIDNIQQGVDQLNRAASQKATAKLEPGDAPGTSNVVVDIPNAESFRLATGYEVNGGALNGVGSIQERARVDVAKDNLFGLNDNWAATFASGVDSNELHASAILPIQWLTLTATAGYSEFLTLINDAAVEYEREWTAGLNASYVLSRDKAQQTTLDTSLNYRSVLRWIDLAELTPQDLAILRVGVSQTRYYDQAQLSYGIGVDKGLTIFGATRDRSGADAATPRAQLVKIDGTVSFTDVIKPWGSLKLDLAAQWSPTALYQDDQLILGSVTSVRGFARDPAFADKGALIRTEFAPNVPIDSLFGDKIKDWGIAYDNLKAIQPYVFTDGGYGRDIANALTVSRASVGAGVRYNYGRVNLDWSIAKPLEWRGEIMVPSANAIETYVNLTVTLF
jgi:hemolysin activation/secretion protein